MLARRLRIAQSIELAVYLAIAGFLHRSKGWSIGEAAVLVVALILGIRLVLLLASFLLTWVHRTPRGPGERIGAGATLAMLLREWVTLVKFNLLYFPWESAFVRPDPAAGPATGMPVILVHGYFANRGNFAVAVRHLEALGVGPVFVPNLRSFNASIERFEEDLDAVVERVFAATGRRVALVGHSMGGLGIRAYLARRGKAKVDRVVMIGSPHAGTALAPLGQGENARQMRVGSAFLAALARSEGDKGPGIPATCIYSAHDNMVAPQSTSRLPWARNHVVRGYGHLELIEAPEVLRMLREALA